MVNHELPPSNARWVRRRKAAVVAALRAGQITFEEACRYYQLSEAELLSWQRAFDTYRLRGLIATALRGRPRRLGQRLKGIEHDGSRKTPLRDADAMRGPDKA
jgi:hypothetical protein